MTVNLLWFFFVLISYWWKINRVSFALLIFTMPSRKANLQAAAKRIEAAHQVRQQAACHIQTVFRGMQTRTSGYLLWGRVKHVTVDDYNALIELLDQKNVNDTINSWRFDGDPDYFRIFGYFCNAKRCMFTSKVVKMWGTSYIQTRNSLYKLGESYYGESPGTGVDCSNLG